MCDGDGHYGVCQYSWEQLANELPAIYLVGPMGAGKTTIGKMLAKHLQRDFIDCDWYIVNQTGADIPWIFDKEGETGFRERETRALMELTTSSKKIVLATGGGAVERQENRMLLKQGLVIYLEASVEVQWTRTKKDKNRPLLQNSNPKRVLEELYARRHPLYKQVADLVVPTSRMYPRQMVAQILCRLSDYVAKQKR